MVPTKHRARILTDTTLSCTSCGKMKTFDSFPQDKSSKYGLGSQCSECANKKARAHHAARVASDPSFKRKKKDAYIKHKYKITLDQYENKLLSQGCRCAICDIPLATSGSRTHLDHCHNTNVLRDFLCTNCNRGLGHFQDSSHLLRSAAKYLDKHKEIV